MKIVLNKSDLDDWYVIERAEHEGRVWLERTGPNGMKFMDSARISDACLEGTAEEMREIAKAIKDHGSASFRRCSVRVDGGYAYFCSPRNSKIEAVVPLEDAAEFADLALAMLNMTNDRAGTGLLHDRVGL